MLRSGFKAEGKMASGSASNEGFISSPKSEVAAQSSSAYPDVRIQASASTTEDARPTSASLPSPAHITSREVSVEVYREVAEQASTTYSRLSAWERLRIEDPFSLSSQVVVLICFGFWWLLLPPIDLANLNFISTAHAQTGNVISANPKELVQLAVFSALFVAFAVSLLVHYLGKGTSARNAGVVSNLLLGFFIGAGNHYLGIAS